MSWLLSSPAEPGVSVFPPVGGTAAVDALDALVLCMVALTCLHAHRHGSWALALSGLGLGLVVEQASLRFGGTHCHASGRINISDCSSANSVFYYVPWVYAGVTSARRLVDERSWAFPLLCGVLFFGMCGVYESQGPFMGWWLWPRADGVVKPGCDIWQHGVPGADRRGLVVSAHAAEALSTRVHGVPALAPYFHFAFGWGIARALQLSSFRAPLLAVILGPSLGAPNPSPRRQPSPHSRPPRPPRARARRAGMLWDPPVRVIELCIGASKSVAAAALMLGSLVVAVAAGPPFARHDAPAEPRNGKERKRASAADTSAPDALLFAIPLLNGGYFLHHALLGRGAAVLPPDLRAFVITLALCATALYARAAGLVGAAEATAPSSWLDRLQLDAQRSELEPSNTMPSTFLALALVQPLACAALASALGLPSELATLPILSHACMFVASHYVLKTDKFFDITGEVTFVALIAYSHLACASAGEPTRRQSLLTALSLLWAVRLGVFLGWRIFSRGSDWRFDKLMIEPCYNAFGWVSQGTWIFLQGMCVWLCHTRPAPSEASGPELNALDWVGVIVFAVGLCVETVADVQKTRWNAANGSGRQKSWIRVGLWRYSRHPNYFGENLLWLGLFLLSASHLAPSLGAPTGGGMPTVEQVSDLCAAFVSPVWSTAFLLFTSLMLLEKRLDAKFGGKPEYEKYKRATSVLVPWPLAE